MQFTVPAGFAAMPVGASVKEAEAAVTARMTKEAREALDSDPRAFQNLVDDVQKVSQALERSGTLYAGTCVRTYDGELSFGTLLVTVTPFEFGDATVAANGIIRSLTAGRGDSWTGSVFDTPNGPMAVVSGVKNLQIPAGASPSGEELDVAVAEMQAFLPVPKGSECQQQCLVCINFTTPREDHWDEYCGDMADLMRSITFDEPSPHPPGTGMREAEREERAPSSTPAEPDTTTPPTGGERRRTPFG
ncbi:hypothetical protein ACFU90_11580 [Streptomyces noursei]|uniref:hypothetical protein n=1 Tax=Streptomyces noursei TaxID=1971 RepID=UPI00045EF5BC|nr:hypothetical protein [Streptomyces noursei]AIA05675.1 hypothetical protein DC74_5211 [Streptomyces noursei]